MSAERAAKLYTPDLLGLATELSRYPLSGAMPYRAEARSRTCGSSLEIELELGEEGEVAAIGMRVSACAVGQAAAAIFAKDVLGRSPSDIANRLGSLENWLSGSGHLPDWRDIEVLLPALQHQGRHGAILLPWRAANEALSIANTSR